MFICCREALLGQPGSAAALGAYRALRPYFSMYPQALAIKWPNDLLADGRKICGILLESEALGDGRIAIVIGCGVAATAGALTLTGRLTAEQDGRAESSG